jgi:hypothetical protein
MSFKIFVGIDQTGAVNANGKPKHLDVSIIDRTETRAQYYTGLKLTQITHHELSLLIKSKLKSFTDEKVLICVDSVLGLPKELDVTPKEILKKIKNFTYNEKKYGALTAHAFFNQFLHQGLILHREVELRVKANSVFRLKPFQRNIGCGTYRVLKELAQGEKWFDLWPFEKLNSQFIIAEGYPSYFWKHLLGAKSRDLQFLKQKFKSLHFTSVDEADSFVLAYGAMKSIEQLSAHTIPNFASREGWILGVPFEKESNS